MTSRKSFHRLAKLNLHWISYLLQIIIHDSSTRSSHYCEILSNNNSNGVGNGVLFE